MPYLKSLPFFHFSDLSTIHSQVPSSFSFSISHFLYRMSDNSINLMTDSESDTSYVSRMRIFPDFHLPHIDHDHMEPEVILLFDGYLRIRWMEELPHSTL